MEKIKLDNKDDTGLKETIPTSALTGYSPNNPPWNSLQALLVWILSVGFVFIFPAVFVIPYIISQNISFSDNEALSKAALEPTAVLVQLAAVIPAHLFTLLIAWAVITKTNKYSFKEMLGWDWGGYNWWQTSLIMIGLLILVMLFAFGATQIFGQQDNDFLKILRSSRYAVFLVAIIATFSAPIVEEVVYRGVLYSAFQRTFNIPIAVLLVTVVFAVVHFPQYWGANATLLTLTFLSLVITIIRVKTNSLLPCILFHFLINGFQSILLILQPYLPDSFDPTKVEAFFF